MVESKGTKNYKTLGEYLEQKHREWESLCIRCGACCGVFEDDPCVCLVAKDNNTYFCSVYENRFGVHKTKKGNDFKCVSLKQILGGHWTGDYRCVYKKKGL